MMRKELCSGAMDDLAHVKTEYCLSDCLTKQSAKPDALIEAIETGRLPYVDFHPLYRSLIKHKAFLVAWLCDVLPYKPKFDSFFTMKVSPEYQQRWKDPTKQALACNVQDNVWLVDNDKGIAICAHVKPRKTFFLPSTPSCPVPLERLSSRRDTIMQVNATTVTAVQDDWKSRLKSDKHPIHHWCGYTVFWLN